MSGETYHFPDYGTGHTDPNELRGDSALSVGDRVWFQLEVCGHFPGSSSAPNILNEHAYCKFKNGPDQSISDALIKAYERLDRVAQVIAGAEETGRISVKGHDALRECVFEIARLRGVE